MKVSREVASNKPRRRAERALRIIRLAFIAQHLEVAALGLGANLAQHLRYLIVDAAVGREELRAREVQRSAIHVGDRAARLLDKE
jgi:hypothetical protein